MLEVRCRIDHEAILFELEGDVGPSTSALLELCLDAAFDIDAARVIIDLTAVDALAESGIAVLSEMRSRCAASGRALQLRSESTATASVVDLFDWDGSGPSRPVASVWPGR